MFKRKIEKRLYDYYDNKDENILIIKGARQIGKSFIIRNTAERYFKNYIEIDLKSDYENKMLFKNIKSTNDFYILISSIYGDKLNTVDDTIVFLDEIQYYPHLITLLKDLRKENKFRYIASGSLLGITLKHIFIPMGSIDEVEMFPLDFEEFLWANNVGDDVIEYLHNSFLDFTPLNESIHERIMSLFKDYLISGGLPDSIKEYVLNKNVFKTRQVQEQIFRYYRDDCARYAIQNKLKIMNIYDSLISNMENKVKRVNFKKIENKENSNFRKYQDEFDYLIASGISNPVLAISNPKFPLSESSAKNLIKLYYNDVGILSNLLFKNNIEAILYKDKSINLGSVYETACAMELIAHGHKLFYFDSKKVGEVDFLINDYNDLSVIPIEIKSGNDQNNFRALPKLIDSDGGYKLSKGYLFGNKNIIERKNNLITLPVYMIMFL